MITSTKNDFLHEKAMEKKTMQNMIQKMKTQTTQIRKQCRQTKNENKQIEDETFEFKKVYQVKNKKSTELIRQNTDMRREINDLNRDCEELVQCKAVLENELSEEQDYQEQMRSMIAGLKRSIYEVKTERERCVKEINQGRKIYTNLERMCEMAS